MKPFELLSPSKSTEVLGCWASHTGEYNEVIGYTATGALLLRASRSLRYFVLYPLMLGNNAKSYGTYESFDEFRSQVLETSEFQSACLQPRSQAELECLAERLGELGAEEVYFPVPHPAVGGSGALETYEKGNLWVFVEIAGQNRGLGA